MNKTAIRKKYKQLRAQLTSEEIEDMSMAIANRVLSLPIWEKTYFHLFLSISEKREVNTDYLLHILQGRDKSIIVSKADFSSHSMQHILLQENTAIIISSYGIPEPVSGIEVPEKQIEVVFVPLLAYDKKGNRIGYGKGFYDRFLENCTPETIVIGLSFFPPENTIEATEYDVPLTFCVTPESVLKY